MPAPQRISVVITTYNRSNALLSVLAGLRHQDDGNFEVVVADDGSRDEHVAAILESPIAQNLGVVHVWHPDVGFTASRARNRGVGASSGDYVVFLDGDCVPEIDFIRQHRLLAQRGCLVNGSRVMLSPTLTERVIAGQELPYGRSWPVWWCWRFCGDAGKLTGTWRLPDGAYRLQPDFRWKGIRSCNMGVWREDFEAVNGFDESFVGWGHEDADFVLRLHNAGIIRKNGFCATEVFHLWHKEFSRQQESVNAITVRQRVRDGTVLPREGFTNSCNGPEVRVTRLG
ncbi:glycosyltransferase family 2 protein [Curvibacter sp. APW13]|uniref:glycosyltransferase family 2 protein n=1 Tax=Curvibacter sp. APW13 TaxID=3077236 RepID=UPI0028DFF970|nr:glycosyltransferase family 2 protein [Curvibacter sp. APW13]MDT8991572.1 glycosyltransferase family 2 protein [Curvibacter sp. APW13]